jgi:predicted nucleic acid-binding protein
MKLYFDTCCWGRSEDDHKDAKNYSENNAILKIIAYAKRYGYPIYGSLALDEEIGANPSVSKREKVMRFYNGTVTARADYVEGVFNYVEPLAESAGCRGRDIFHLCYAVACGADYLLTTDKKFLNVAARLALPVKIINPLYFNVGGVI